MASNNLSDRRRRGVLIALAAMLVIAGLVLAATAPAGPSASNKVDAYGGPIQTAPKNPKSVAECDAYYTAQNQSAETRECRSLATYNVALKRCAKKKGAKKAACTKAAKRAYAKAKAKVAKQRAADKTCQSTYSAALNAIDPNAADASDRQDAAGAAYSACLKKAESAG